MSALAMFCFRRRRYVLSSPIHCIGCVYIFSLLIYEWPDILVYFYRVDIMLHYVFSPISLLFLLAVASNFFCFSN